MTKIKFDAFLKQWASMEQNAQNHDWSIITVISHKTRYSNEFYFQMRRSTRKVKVPKRLLLPPDSSEGSDADNSSKDPDFDPQEI